ncbi:MAG TPA: response regulator [Gemmatimonadaceae bacterium]|nr:response regulator [Gemmatimonadaceae bacterium]
MRVLIVDDEEPARRKIRRLLSGETDVEIVGEAATGTEAIEAIRRLTPDLVFLDVQIPPPNGFGIIDALGRDNAPDVIFVTAFDEHALRAFEVRALDYLLKPVTPARFREALDRARERSAAPSSAPARPKPLARILVRDDTKAFLLALDRVDRIEADGNYVRLHSNGRSFTVRMAIGALAGRLDADQFLRISRSAIVRLDAIKELHPWFHGDYHVVMTDGARLTWTRRYRAAATPELGGSRGT